MSQTLDTASTEAGAEAASQADALAKAFVKNEILDCSNIAEICRSVGAETALTLVSAYKDELDIRLNSIQKAFEQNKLALLANESHSLKGASGTFGAPRVEKTSRQLELAVKNTEPVSNDMLESLALACTETKKALSRIQAALSSMA